MSGAVAVTLAATAIDCTDGPAGPARWWRGLVGATSSSTRTATLPAGNEFCILRP